MRVEVRDNDVMAAARKLKKKLFNEGVIREVMARRYYEKPSEAKQRQKREARRRHLKERQKRHYQLGI